MNRSKTTILFSSAVKKLDGLTQRNDSFDKGILRVCYHGLNRNKSFISKETFERCMGSIYNCPIVCNYSRESDEIGGHDSELVVNDETMSIVNITQPVGVIPESAETFWEKVEEEDGSTHEYLCVPVLIWKRQEAYKKLVENSVTDESMEITVKSSHMEDDVLYIDDFEFTAFCLLGNVEPCFESASLAVFSMDSLKEQFSLMMGDLKREYASSTSCLSSEVIHEPKGGKNELNENIVNMLAEFGLSKDVIDFDVDGLTDDEIREKLEKIKADKDAARQHEFELANQFLRELTKAVSAERVETEWGDYARYWYWDHDDESKIVYVHDSENYDLYGMSYEFNGDNVVVDFESKKRKKISIVDFDEGESVVSRASFNVFAEIMEDVKSAFSKKDDEYSKQINAAHETEAALTEEVESLRAFKSDIEGKAAMAAREEIFGRFSDLSENESFVELREHASEYSLEDLEEKCFAIRGRTTTTARFSAQNEGGTKPVKLPILSASEVKEEPYGGVFAKFGITNKT